MIIAILLNVFGLVCLACAGVLAFDLLTHAHPYEEEPRTVTRTETACFFVAFLIAAIVQIVAATRW